MVCNEIGYAKIFAIYVEFRSEASSPASFWANTLHKRDFQKGTKNCFPFSNFSSFGVFFLDRQCWILIFHSYASV